MSSNGTVAELPPPFASPSQLRRSFESGLEGMLDSDVLGAFILVLANASFEPAMFERLRAPLQRAFDHWCSRVDRAAGTVRDAAADDVAVFERLRALGFANLTTTRWRETGPWQVQFNPLRALRPPRMSNAVVTELQRPFDERGFHFNRPFLRREVLWHGDMLGVPLRLLYNKFPFASLHGLLVPEPDACKPQMLGRADHALIWRLAERLGRTLPGVGFGYNAYGAYASVNHLHLQFHVRAQGHYPIEAPGWLHNGGGQQYPLAVQRFGDLSASWSALQDLHAKGVTYNLLYRPGVLYLAPRRQQGSYPHSDWTGGFAWSEIAGAVTVFDERRFDTLGASDIEAEFAALAVRP